MTIRHPDRWVVVELGRGDEVVRKVFCGGYGGYGGSDTWKLSSSIVEVFDDETAFEIRCSSGSTYMCHKQSYGMSGYMSSIYSGWLQQSKTSDITIKLVEEYDRTK